VVRTNPILDNKGPVWITKAAYVPRANFDLICHKNWQKE
jgi:hypothetical protein